MQSTEKAILFSKGWFVSCANNISIQPHNMSTHVSKTLARTVVEQHTLNMIL